MQAIHASSINFKSEKMYRELLIVTILILYGVRVKLSKEILLNVINIRFCSVTVRVRYVTQILWLLNLSFCSLNDWGAVYCNQVNSVYLNNWSTHSRYFYIETNIIDIVNEICSTGRNFVISIILNESIVYMNYFKSVCLEACSILFVSTLIHHPILLLYQ